MILKASKNNIDTFYMCMYEVIKCTKMIVHLYLNEMYN